MTSRSLKNPRTTASRITPVRTGFSFAAIALFGAAAPAVDPPPQWQRPNIPPVQVAPPALPPAADPLPRVEPGSFPPVGLPTPGRTVAFQKPTGSDTPAAADPKVQPPKPTEPLKPGEAPKPGPTPAYSATTGKDRVFRFESDAVIQARIGKELIDETSKWAPNLSPEYFSPPEIAPYYPVGAKYQTKPLRESYPPAKSLIEPDYVVHRRLYFEDKNSERYGWDLGIVQPIVSTAIFYKDTLLWPANVASHLFEQYDTSAGKYLPGTPVPYFLYPPEIDLFGFGVGGFIIGGAAVILP